MCRWTWMTRHRQPAADDVSSLHDPPAFLRMLFDAAVAAAGGPAGAGQDPPPPPARRTACAGKPAGRAESSHRQRPVDDGVSSTSTGTFLSLIHISEPTRLGMIS